MQEARPQCLQRIQDNRDPLSEGASQDAQARHKDELALLAKQHKKVRAADLKPVRRPGPIIKVASRQ